jgi:hypothetical protein
MAQATSQAAHAENGTTKAVNTAPNATVSVRQIEQINGSLLNYVVIDTLKGRVAISIGEKNMKAIQELVTK